MNIEKLWRYFPLLTLHQLKICLNEIKNQTGVSHPEIVKIIIKNMNLIPIEYRSVFVFGFNVMIHLVSKSYKKDIYLTGEQHEESKCPNDMENKISFESFLDRVIRSNTDKVIDIFLETKFYTYREYEKESITKVNPLSKLDKFFHDCLVPDKSKCKYKNVRVHHVDVRHYFNLHIIIGEVNKMKRKASTFKKVKDMVDKIFPLNPEEIYDNTKTRKQLESIHNKDISDKLMNLFFTFIEKINESMEKAIKNKFTDYNELLQNSAVLQDVYTVGRVMRTFNTKGKSDQPRYIFIHVGTQHAKNLVKIFTSFDFQMGKVSEELSDMCTDITPFIPFFGK